ncbi:MAG TPA: cytochrome c [Terriglobales bacterium]|nr:cytochrome c [Terriglobales bacterium]
MLNLRKVSPLAMVTVLLLAGCRQDMHNQPRFKPLAESDFYADLRSARPPVEGTVARGELHADTYYYSGLLPGTNTPGDYMPFAVDEQVLARGRERFNVYCSPCHSRLGDGNGIVPSRGFARKPPSFHIDRLRKAPLGYFFDVMTRGFGMMPDYASQISPEDRWKIVAYVRALQLSQNATSAEVPQGQQIPSSPPKFRGEPPTGGVLPEVEAPAANSEQERK